MRREIALDFAQNKTPRKNINDGEKPDGQHDESRIKPLPLHKNINDHAHHRERRRSDYLKKLFQQTFALNIVKPGQRENDNPKRDNRQKNGGISFQRKIKMKKHRPELSDDIAGTQKIRRKPGQKQHYEIKRHQENREK